VTRLGEEIIRKALRNFGLTEKETDVYVFLSKHGVLKGGEVSKETKTDKALVYRALKSLQARGFVECTLEFPARFTAVPFENVIDLNIRVKQDEAAQIKERKMDLLNYWKKIEKPGPQLQLEKFTIIEGNPKVYHKLSQMMRETRNQLSTVTTVQGLARADQLGLFDIGSAHTLKSKIKFRFLATLSSQNTKTLKEILKTLAAAKFNFEGRTPELGIDLFPQMTIRDQEEAIFFITPRADASLAQQDDVCLWTNCKSLVNAFSAVFEDLWRNSTDISEKIREIETGKPTPKTIIITDAEIARKKYTHIMKMATEEIYAITSSEGLIELSKDLLQVNNWNEKGVTLKIMAPIMDENLEVSNDLSSFCLVKHVPPNYTQTIIIDGKHLFQSIPSNTKNLINDMALKFENIFYTTNAEYIQKTKTMLQEIWKNSSPPSPDNLKSIFGSVRSQSAYFPGAIQSLGPDGSMYPLSPVDSTKKSDQVVVEIVDDDPLGKMTQQDVLDEIINVQKSAPEDQTGISKIYSSQAIAIIHPPDFFKLPPMLIRFHHIEKQSKTGEEDAIIINLWLETSSGHAYVPVAVFSDNPKSQVFWRRNYSATPAGRNVQLANKDELKIWLHGNTMFAGWTVPIQLFPEQNILPPACMLIEGYGNVKTEAYSVVESSGGKFKVKQNGFNAFVTFMHSSSKYSGPGTDGFLVRDFIGEVSPQFIKGFRSALEVKVIEKGKF
jgi:sugar-specific transcriptional regulator TrmB